MVVCYHSQEFRALLKKGASSSSSRYTFTLLLRRLLQLFVTPSLKPRGPRMSSLTSDLCLLRWWSRTVWTHGKWAEQPTGGQEGGEAAGISALSASVLPPPLCVLSVVWFRKKKGADTVRGCLFVVGRRNKGRLCFLWLGSAVSCRCIGFLEPKCESWEMD